jgi:hypothetical protein
MRCLESSKHLSPWGLDRSPFTIAAAVPFSWFLEAMQPLDMRYTGGAIGIDQLPEISASSWAGQIDR